MANVIILGSNSLKIVSPQESNRIWGAGSAGKKGNMKEFFSELEKADESGITSMVTAMENVSIYEYEKIGGGARQ